MIMWQEVINAAIDHYQGKISELSDRIKKTQGDAAKAPGAMQSWSDKSKQEFSQLADSMIKNLAPLETTLKTLQNLKSSATEYIAVGSIVLTTAKNEDDQEYLLIVPDAGGDQISANDKSFFLLSKNSEFAKMLIGKKAADKVELKSGNEIEIAEVINK